nr:hypothetical protein BCU25_09525 [Vibrio cyclitrophicus]
MSNDSLIEAIKAAPKISNEIKIKASKVIEELWGQHEVTPMLRNTIEMAVCKAEEGGDTEAIYADLELFLSKQKQNQNLSQGQNL